MEDSPLTLAHQHASQASNILFSSHPPHSPSTLLAAASSHSLASTSFASAAKLTKDPEALRTLELLSTEHQRWAANLKREAERPVEKEVTAFGGLETVIEASGSTEGIREKDDIPTSSSTKGKHSSKDATSTPQHPSLPFANTGSTPIPPRLQKSTSSLATNLASARGIPQSQVTVRIGSGASSPNRRRSGIHTTGGQPLPGAHDFPSSAKPTTNPLNFLPPDEPPAKKSTTPASSRTKPQKEDSRQEEPFSKFYSSLNTLVSRIGSPFAASLAFAGLPVGDEEDEDAEKEAKRNLLPRGWTEGRGRGRGLEKGWAVGEGGESFYVVPVSGGTLSYAGVVRRDASPASSPTDDGGFEPLKLRGARTYPGDASSSPPPPLPSLRNDQAAQLSGHSKTKEELQLENTGLRQTIDHMSRTMHTWQRKTKESENMLKNSIMALSKNPGATSDGRAGLDILSQVQRKSWLHVPYDEGDDNEISEGRRVGEMEWEKEKQLEREREAREAKEEAEEKEERIRQLEEELEGMRRELESSRREVEKMGRENEKLKQVLEKARAKWDKLKEGAKSRKASTAGVGASGQLSRVEEGE